MCAQDDKNKEKEAFHLNLKKLYSAIINILVSTFLDWEISPIVDLAISAFFC